MLFLLVFASQKNKANKKQVNRKGNMRVGFYRCPGFIHFGAPMYVVKYQHSVLAWFF